MSWFIIKVEETTSSKRFDLADFEKDLNDYERKVFPQAINRTVNDVGKKARTATMRELTKTMGVKKKSLKKRYFHTTPSTFRTLSFTWTGRSKPLPLKAFKGKGLKHRSQKGKMGYSASVMNKRRKYKFFKAKMSNGYEGAFYRLPNNKHQRSRSGKVGAYPIKQAYGASVPNAMVQDVVEKIWNKSTEQKTFEAKLDSNMKFYVGKLLKKSSR